MQPTSGLFILLVLTLGLAVPILVGVLWWRRGGPSRRRRAAVAAGLAAAVVLSQGLAVVGVAAVLNRQLGFYPTWTALAGALSDGDPLAGMAGPAGQDVLSSGELSTIATRGWGDHRVQPATGNGSYRDYLVTGIKARTTQKVVVWMPPGYEKAADARGLPVLLVLGGAYVTTDFAANGLRFGDVAGPMVRSGQLKPFVALLPEVNIKMPHDTECVDFPGGPQAYSWLASDVPSWAVSTLHVDHARDSWAVMGWSLGGYCAAKLTVSSPQLFRAGAAIQGFFVPWPDGTTGALSVDLAHSEELRHQSDVAWMVRNRPVRDLRLMVMSSPTDPQSWPATDAFLKATQGVPGITPLVVPDQGHTLNAWRATLPTVLPFLMQGQGATAPTTGDGMATGGGAAHP
ncbi:alpha/beta hydrolase [Arsenicicoccus dermatophilus]|uniref:alpha/beta hydrolase n=1 Tax=Arsenicicoccus dermatophilus TaxID=1076331 RepID=UPI0039170B2F